MTNPTQTDIDVLARRLRAWLFFCVLVPVAYVAVVRSEQLETCNEELAVALAERDVAAAALATTRADLLDTQGDLLIEKSEADECHGSWSELFDMMWECEHVDFWDRCQPLLEEQWNDFGGPNGCHEELNLVWDMRCRGDYAGIQAMLTCEGYDQQ